jgi:hypothetical protein
MNTDTHDRSIHRQDGTKVCPLCGMLNPLRHPECCVCGWHGAFERGSQTPEFVQERLRMPSGRKGTGLSRAMPGPGPAQQGMPHQWMWPRFAALWWRTALAAARQTFGRSG